MNSTPNPLTTFPEELAKLAKDLADATRELDVAEVATGQARSEETRARNRLNEVQKAMDALMETVRKTAPMGSDWASRKRIFFEAGNSAPQNG